MRSVKDELRDCAEELEVSFVRPESKKIDEKLTMSKMLGNLSSATAFSGWNQNITKRLPVFSFAS